MPWPPSPLHVQTQTFPSDPTSRPSHVELFVPWTCAKGGWQGEKKICCLLLLFFCWCLVAGVWTMWFCSWKGFVTKSLGALSGWSTLQSFSFLDVLELLLMYLSFGELNIVRVLLYVIEYIYIYTPVWFITHMIRIHVANPNVWSNGRDPLQKIWVVIVTSVAPNWSFTWYFHAVSCLFLRSLGW